METNKLERVLRLKNQLIDAFHSDIPTEKLAPQFKLSKNTLRTYWGVLKEMGWLPPERKLRPGPCPNPQRKACYKENDPFDGVDGRPDVYQGLGHDPLLAKLVFTHGSDDDQRALMTGQFDNIVGRPDSAL